MGKNKLEKTTFVKDLARQKQQSRIMQHSKRRCPSSCDIREKARNMNSHVVHLQGSLHDLNREFDAALKNEQQKTMQTEGDNNRLREERSALKRENDILWRRIGDLKLNLKTEKNKTASLLSKVQEQIGVVQRDTAHLLDVTDNCR